MSTVEALKAARALIEKGWTQGASARNADGEPVPATSYAARRWCPLGAILATGKREFPWNAQGALRRQLDGYVLTDWNDQPGRTQAEVLALFDKAIAAEEVK